MAKPDFKIIKVLGSGGMGEVFLVEILGDGAFRKKAALKKQIGTVRSPAEFEKEATLLSKIQHPNIVNVLNYWLEDGYPHILLEYISGQSLDEIFAALASRGFGLPESLVAEILLKLIGVLEYLQSGIESQTAEKVVHLDITPHNVKIDFNGSVKLLDFGVAKLIGPDTTSKYTYNISGKSGYFAPEVVNNNQVSPAADIFCVGIIGFELLSGKRLFPGETMGASIHQIATLDRSKVRDFCAPYPTLHKALEFLLDPDPKNRFQKMSEAKSILTKAVDPGASQNLFKRIEEVLQSSSGSHPTSSNPDRTATLSRWKDEYRTLVKQEKISLPKVLLGFGVLALVGDFSSPIGNLSLISVIIAGLACFAIVSLKKQKSVAADAVEAETRRLRQRPLSKALVYAGSALMVFAIFFGIKAIAGSPKEQGLLASQFSIIAELQKSVFQLEKNTGELARRLDKLESSGATTKKVYSTAQLKKLEEQELWSEIFEHLEDVDPLSRDASWESILEHATIERAKSILANGDTAKAEQEIFPIFNKFKSLKKSARAMELRRDLGIKAIEFCLRQENPLADCHPLSMEIINYDATTRSEIAFQVGVLTTYHRFHRGGLPYFEIAMESPKANYCEEERLDSAVMNGINLMDDDPFGKSAVAVVDRCFPHFKKSMTTQLRSASVEKGYYRDLCRVFKKHGFPQKSCH